MVFMLNIEDHKNNFGVELTRKLGQLLENGEIKLAECGQIAEYILSNIDSCSTLVELHSFLQELNNRYPYFENVLQLEEGYEKEEKDQEKAAKMEELLKHNQVDQAIATGK